MERTLFLTTASLHPSIPHSLPPSLNGGNEGRELLSNLLSLTPNLYSLLGGEKEMRALYPPSLPPYFHPSLGADRE